MLDNAGGTQVCLFTCELCGFIYESTPTWQSGASLVQLLTVFVGMRVLCKSKVQDKSEKLQRMFLFFVDSPIGSNQAQVMTLNFFC